MNNTNCKFLYIVQSAAQQTSIIELSRHNVSRQEMFSSANYKPGTRYWVLETSDSKIIECAVVIDQLQNFSKYLRVTCNHCEDSTSPSLII